MRTDEKIHTWDLSTGREVGSPRNALKPVYKIAYSSSGNYLIAIHWNTASVYDCYKDSDPVPITVPMTYPGRFAFSPTDDELLVAGPENYASIFDLPEGKLRIKLQGGTNPVRSVAWSPDGALVATSSDATKIWDAVAGQVISKLPLSASAISFSPTSHLLGGIDNDKDAHQTDGSPSIKALWIFNLKSGKELPIPEISIS